MEEISIVDSEWVTTLPHRLAPITEEWLISLLLRCDQINNWNSKTTLAYANKKCAGKFNRCWRSDIVNLISIAKNSLDISRLSQLLAVSEDDILATTYHKEATLLLNPKYPHPHHLVENWPFQICPQCIEQDGIIRRDASLPHLLCCPKHSIAFQTICSCKVALQPFRRQSMPFTCFKCNSPWSSLPKKLVSQQEDILNKKILSWYLFFFSQSNSAFIQYALFLARKYHPKINLVDPYPIGWMPQQISRLYPLSSLIAHLVERDLTPSYLLASLDTIPCEILGLDDRGKVRLAILRADRGTKSWYNDDGSEFFGFF